MDKYTSRVVAIPIVTTLSLLVGIFANDELIKIVSYCTTIAGTIFMIYLFWLFKNFNM